MFVFHKEIGIYGINMAVPVVFMYVCMYDYVCACLWLCLLNQLANFHEIWFINVTTLYFYLN